jgi:hypothetical protein
MTNEEFLEYWLILPWGNDKSLKNPTFLSVSLLFIVIKHA